MKHASALVVAFLLVVTACKKDDAPPPAFKAPLTVENVMAAKNAVGLCEDTWDVAFAKLQSRLGPPTKVDATTGAHTWAARDTSRCALIRFDRGECPPEWKKPGLRVNLSTDPFMTTADSTEGNHKGCLDIAPAT